jgi:hypothetical protein
MIAGTPAQVGINPRVPPIAMRMACAAARIFAICASPWASDPISPARLRPRWKRCDAPAKSRSERRWIFVPGPVEHDLNAGWSIPETMVPGATVRLRR